MAGRAITVTGYVGNDAATDGAFATCPYDIGVLDGVYISGDETNDRTCSVYVVASGVTPADQHLLLRNAPIPANDCLDMELQSPIYMLKNGEVYLEADAANQCSGFVSIREHIP